MRPLVIPAIIALFSVVIIYLALQLRVSRTDCRGQHATAILSHFPDGDQSVAGCHYGLAEETRLHR